jgi:alcohol dehydrogenase
MLLGFEAAGPVEAVGENGDDDDPGPGDRVVMTFLPGCGACEGKSRDSPRGLRGVRRRAEQRKLIVMYPQ